MTFFLSEFFRIFFKKKTMNKTSYFDFLKIGSEFRRLSKCSSPFLLGSAIINLSLNSQANSASFEEITNSPSYSNVLKAVFVVFRRFKDKCDICVAFDQLLNFCKYSKTPNHRVGEYAFIQNIAALPDFELNCKQVQALLNIFPSLTEALIISRIYSNPYLFLNKNSDGKDNNIQIDVHFLLERGADSNFIQHFLAATFKTAFHFFSDLTDTNLKSHLMTFLKKNPQLFETIYSLVNPASKYSFIENIMNNYCQDFFKLFFEYENTNTDTQLRKIVVQAINKQILTKYCKQSSDHEMDRKMIDFLLKNGMIESLDFVSGYLHHVINQYLSEIYSHSPDLINNVFKQRKHSKVFTDFFMELIPVKEYPTLFDCILSMRNICSETLNIILEDEKNLFFFINNLYHKFSKFSESNILSFYSKVLSYLILLYPNSVNAVSLILLQELSQYRQKEQFANQKLMDLAFQIYEIDELAFLNCFDPLAQPLNELLKQVSIITDGEQLHFPSKKFFQAIHKKGLPNDFWSKFFSYDFDNIIKNEKWREVISSNSSPFYSFFRIINPERLQNNSSLLLDILVNFTNNMITTFRNYPESFKKYLRFISNDLPMPNFSVHDFPLYLKIKLVDLMSYSTTPNLLPNLQFLYFSLVDQYDAFSAIDLEPKICILQGLIKPNLSNIQSHSLFLIIFEKEFNSPFQEITNILPFPDYLSTLCHNPGLQMVLNSDEKLFNIWYSWISTDENWTIIDTDPDLLVKPSIFHLMLSGLKYEKYQKDPIYLERLSILIPFVVGLYSSEDNVFEVNYPSLSKLVMKAVLINKKSNPDPNTRQIYCNIYQFITEYMLSQCLFLLS